MANDKTFADFQRYKCKDIEVEDLGVDLPKFCPSCEKDPSYVEPTWYSTIEPYLDKKNCLYKVNITQIIKDLNLDLDEEALSTYSITFGNHTKRNRDYRSNPTVQSQIIRTAIYQMLINYDKELKFKHICNTINCDVIKSKPLSNSDLERLEEILDALKFLKKSIIEDIEDGDAIIFEEDDYESYFEYTIQLDDDEVLSPILTVTLDEYNLLLAERESLLEKTRVPIDNFNAYGLENHATIEQVYHPANPTAGSTVQFLVSVPAFSLDRIPSSSAAEDDDNEPDKGQTFIVEARKLRRHLRTLSSAMYLYSLQYAVARRIDGTAVYYKGSGLKEYDFKYVAKNLKTFPADGKIDFSSDNPVFFERLKDALYQNKFRVDNFQIGAMFYKLAHKIKFKVDQDADKPFQIVNIFVETKECRFKKLKGGAARRLIRYLNNNRFVSRFLSDIKAIDAQLTSARTPEWSTFLPQYAYPPVVIQKAKDNDGIAASDDRVALECLFDQAGIDAIGSGQIRNYFLEELVDLSKLLAFTFNQRACFETSDLVDNNPTSVKMGEIFGADAYKDNKDRFYEQEVGKILSGERPPLIDGQFYNPNELLDTDNFPATLEDYARAIATKTGDSYGPILQTIESEANARAERRVEAQVQQAEDATGLFGGRIGNLTGFGNKRPGNFFTGESGHPLLIEAAERAREKFNYEDSFIKEILEYKRGQVFQYARDGKKDLAGLFSFFGICGYSSLVSSVIECLLGGLSFEQFVAKFIESSLKSISVEQLGLFVDGLPPEAQAKVYAEVQQALGTLVKPWEAGGGFTSNTVSEVASGQPLKFDTSDKALSSDEINEFSEVPKELSAWNDLPRKERREAIDTYGRPRVDVDSDEFTGNYEQSTIGNALNDVVGTFVRAYTTAILNTLDYDILLDKIRDFPGAQILKKILFQFACMTPPLLHPPISESLRTFSLQLCNPQIGFHRPILSKFDLDLSWGVIFKALGDLIKQRLKDIIKAALQALVNKILELLDGLLCRALAGVGKFAGNYLSDAVAGTSTGMSFHTAMREAFCGPDVPQNKVDRLSDELLAGLGYVPNDLNIADVDPQFVSNPNATAGTVAAAIISGTFTKDDLLYHMSTDPENYDTTLLRMAARSINAASPQMGQILGTADQLSAFFASLSNFLSPDQREEILNALQNPSPESPVNNTLCLTNEQYNDWVDRRERLFDAFGFEEGIPQAQDEQLAEDLGDLLDGLINPNGTIEQGINNLMRESICPDGEGIIPRDSDETRELANEVTGEIFDNLRMGIYRDLLGNKGYLNELLTDTEGKSLRRHRFRTFFSRRYVNAEEEKVKRRSKGYFPETVGLHLKEQIEGQLPIFLPLAGDKIFIPKVDSSVRKKFEIFRSIMNSDDTESDQNDSQIGPLGLKRINITIPARRIRNPSVKLYFTDDIENPYTFTIGYSERKRNNPVDEVWSEISIKTQLGESDGDGTIYRHQSYLPAEIINKYEQVAGGTKNPRVSYFKAFMNDKIKVGAPDAPDFGSSLKDLYNMLNQVFLQEMCSDIVKNPNDPDEVSNGFKFGYKAEELTEEDLMYVDPKPGATEYTYRHRDGVLGRSMTNNSRVTFLDPEIYGGRYTNPPYIIEPSKHSGWYGFSNKLIPSHKFCDKKDIDIVGFKYIKKEVNFYYNNLPTDERLKQEKECVVEPPFGKIANRNTKSSLHGIVVAIIRMYLAQGFMNGFPIFANVAFNSKNFSDVFYNFIADILESDLSDTPDRDLILVRTKIMKENYFLLFLEQVVESYQRLIDYKGVKPPKEILEALSIIRDVQAFYKQPDFSDIDALKPDPENPPLDFKLNVEQNEYSLILEKKYKKFFKHAIAYQTFGEAIFFSDNKVQLMRLRKTDRYMRYFRMISKIFCVRLLKKQCMMVMMELMRYESDKLFRTLNRRIKPSPEIDSIVPYMLQNDKLCVTPKHKYGLRKPIDEFAINGEADFGEVHDVHHDINSFNPLLQLTEVEDVEGISVAAAAAGGAAVGGVAGAAIGGAAAAYSNRQEQQAAEQATQDRIALVNKYGRFIIQRYIRVKDKEEMPLAVANRDEKLFEIVNIQKFQQYLETLDQEKSISDYFGDLSFIYSVPVSQFIANGYSLTELYEFGLSEEITELDEETLNLTLIVKQEQVNFDISENQPIEIEGETGLSFGLRICYFPPSNIPLASQSVSNEVAIRNKAFKIKGVPEFPNGSFLIPLIEAEVQMVDQKLSDINFLEGDNSFDLLCMFRELEEKAEYKFLFEDAIPVSTYMSLFALYSNLGFQASWGLGDDERVDPPDENDEEDDEELDLDGDGEEFDFDFYEKSRKRARRIFANFYDQNDFFDNESAGNDDIFDFMLRFNPFRFRLPFRIKWWKRRMRRDYRCGDN